MSLRVIEPGLYTTVQDAGRPGFQAFGIPPAGAFDRLSADLANALAGNASSAAVLEMTLLGGTYEATEPLALALAGAPMIARLRRRDDTDVRLEIPLGFPLEPGERLVLGPAPHGARTYLAVRGGWLTTAILGSRSTELRLQSGAELPCDPGTSPFRRLAANELADRVAGPIRVLEGPDFAAWSADLATLGGTFRVLPESDRVGLRLEGAPWGVAGEPNRVSTPVAPGAVQVAGGKPLILGVSCGTMGGYSHVLHVISADFHRVAQARPGDRIQFSLVTLDEARRLGRETRAALRRTCQRVAAAAQGGWL